MCQSRKTVVQAVIAFYTAINITMLSLIHGTADLRASYQINYMEKPRWWNLLILLGVFVVMMWIQMLGSRYYSILQRKFWRASDRIRILRGTLDKHAMTKIWLTLMVIWFGFFLVFYPGTAMNDTIYILENPWERSGQHPILYNLYTYGLVQLGTMLWNPNFGLALISLIQMVTLSFVIAKAIRLFYDKCKCEWLCWLLTLYFGFSPLFSTYAFSAIKDTPFSICLFAMILLLYEMNDKQKTCKWSYWVNLFWCMCGVISFRSNGLMVVGATMLLVIMLYRCYWKKLLIATITACVGISLVSSALTPPQVERLFQETVGMQLQQIGAVVARGRELTDEQREYLYTLMPEETWQVYAPCTVDTLKWHDDFNREYLNETKQKFIKVWLELLPKNMDVYTEAWVMNTYGFWGIETRNKEQYYQKDIWENDLGLIQNSPLPDSIQKLVYTYYCNRFTYRYLSAGTAFWVMFMLTGWRIYRKEYCKAVVFAPMWCLWGSLLLATPIAFAFRYVFVLAILFPFMILIPFVQGEKDEADL